MRPPPVSHRLSRSFYARPTATVARELLGKALVRRFGRRWIGGVIVETEAYLPEGDLASHSARGETPGNGAMFGIPGSLYVYPIHAKWCMNAVTEEAGIGGAVLIRAIEPLWGLDRMRAHRGQQDPIRLTRGPAMTCQALAIDRGFDRIDLVHDARLTVVDSPPNRQAKVTTTARIGISKANDLPLRFFLDGNPFVSGRRRDHRSADLRWSFRDAEHHS